MLRKLLKGKQGPAQSEKPNAFQVACLARTLEVVQAHNIPAPRYEYVEGRLPYFLIPLSFRDQAYEIAIFMDDVVMYRGEEMFEVYLHRERKSDETLIAGFASRLNRWLQEETWEEPDEVGFLEMLLHRMKRIFR